jgi:hypothetical protein
VRALLERGADPTITDNEGRTPMAMAKQWKQPMCIEALKVKSLSFSPGQLARSD